MPESRLAGTMHAVAQAWRRIQGAGRAERHSLLADAEWEDISAALAQARQIPGQFAAARQRNAGAGQSPLRGRGLDYAQSRAYQPGDDTRAMHWSLLARTGRPYVREYEEEHASPWHALVDVHGSMLFGTRTRTKATQAARTATLAAGLQAALSPQSCLSLSLWSRAGMQARDFGCGLSAVRNVAHWLGQQSHSPPELPAADAEESLLALRGWARRLALHRPAPTRIVICSDFAWLDEVARSALWPLAAKAQMLCLRVLDPVEVDLPDLGTSAFVDAKTASEGGLQAGVQVRQSFARRARQREARALAELRGLQARVAQVLTPEPAASLCARLLELL
ncbi:hypothetical protein GALL_333570 [mine drainage metagenome]|jgi:uncharacterized protein (DUF58 family)|uniref:DUF58 domain-containing protein n=1 Tax=mine drainage metagenome TaxID=410659 RepID=A0A1J5QMQ8_9ZZZZ